MTKVFIFGAGYTNAASVVELEANENIETSKAFRDAVQTYISEYEISFEDVEIVVFTGKPLRLGMTVIDD